MRKHLLALITALLASLLFGDIQFSPLNVRRMELVTGVTHSELRTATNELWATIDSQQYYASTNLPDNVELRIFSGEWVNALYDGEGTADVILDLTGVPDTKVTDTLMVLDCATTGTVRFVTMAGGVTNASRVVHKKDVDPQELKEGLNLLTFSRFRVVNGTNDVIVTNNELGVE